MAVSHSNLHHGRLQLSYFITNTFPFPTQLKNINFFTNSDSLEYTLHVITIQLGVLCVTSEQQTLEFNLETANVNSNIFNGFR